MKDFQIHDQVVVSGRSVSSRLRGKRGIVVRTRVSSSAMFETGAVQVALDNTPKRIWFDPHELDVVDIVTQVGELA